MSSELIILFTAIIFTCMGFWWGFNYAAKNLSSNIIEILIAEGYLKTKGTGDDCEILKWEEHNDQNSGKDS